MPIDFSPERWERVRDNARAWWAGELDRPLIQVTISGRDPGRAGPALPYRAFTAQHGLETPAEAIVDCWDYHLSCRKYPGDAFPGFWPNFGAGVAAVFMGAQMNVADDTVWFHPRRDAPIDELHLSHDSQDPWLGHIKDVCRAAMERWQGLVQVAMTDLGGALDILSTFRPGEGLLLDLYDRPDDVKRLTWEAHELWHRYFADIDAVLRPANPGYSAWAGIYCERPHYMLQCDFCYMISPAMFDEFARPELAASCRRLGNSFYHLDGPGQLAHLDSLLEIEELKGVQWIPGAGRPDMDSWPDVYRRIREAGKLIQLLGGPHILDAVAGQLGTAEGIVLCGDYGPEQEGALMDLLARYGAA